MEEWSQGGEAACPAGGRCARHRRLHPEPSV